MSRNRLKILCFHGYRQDGETFRQKTGSLRKLLKKEAEFFYITAPHLIPAQHSERKEFDSSANAELNGACSREEKLFKNLNIKENSFEKLNIEENCAEILNKTENCAINAKETTRNGVETAMGNQESNISSDLSPGRGWWFSREDNFFSAKHKSNFVKGFQESLDVISEYVKNHGPFDGFLGFSQGGALVAMLCHLRENLNYNFKFAIIICGFLSQATPHSDIVSSESICTLPTLHVYGLNDQVIGSEMSLELLRFFETPSVIVHPGGHFVPASSQLKSKYVEFLQRFSEKI